MENELNAAPMETSIPQPNDAQGVQNAPGTAQPAEPSLVTPEESRAAAERLKQQNARQAKLLSSLGIDPLSDIGEQLESGLITPDMVKNHVLRNTPQPVNEPAADDPMVTAESEYELARRACEEEGQNTGQVSFDTLRRYNEAALKLQDVKAQSVTRQMAAERQAKQAYDNVDRVLTVARSTPYYQGFSENGRQISDLVHVALTGAIAEQEARKLGLNPQTLTPQQCEYFAQKASVKLGELAAELIATGNRQPVNPVPNNQRPAYVPAGSGGSNVGIPNGYQRANIANHQELARQYMANNRPVI